MFLFCMPCTVSVVDFILYSISSLGLLKTFSDQSVCIHARGPQIHPLDFHSGCQIYSLDSEVWSENAPIEFV